MALKAAFARMNNAKANGNKVEEKKRLEVPNDKNNKTDQSSTEIKVESKKNLNPTTEEKNKFEELPSESTSNKVNGHKSEKKMRLEATDYENMSENFLFGSSSRDYSRQFFHLYLYRLEEMTSLLQDKVKAKWGSEIPIKKLCDLKEDVPEKCVIIGTIFKHQKYKPSILREISEENQLAPQPTRDFYADESDKLILEDELQRILLIGKMDVHSIVTGVVCAVLGKNCYVECDGKFIVEEYLFYESGPQKPMKPLNASSHLVLISGIDQISSFHYEESIESLKQWLMGKNPKVSDKCQFSNIARVVIAGNSVRSLPEEKLKTLQTRKPEYPDPVQAVKDLDKWFSEWCEFVHVDIMPGEHDPTNYMLPQQPLHSCMFSNSGKFDTFKTVTNPYKFELSERLVLGTSGQNVHDIIKTSKVDDPLEALKSTIIWSHVSPTCPDTLACYPYVKNDPFIIKNCPHIYFAGNLDKFQTDIYEGSNGQKTRLICIPSFAKTQSVVIVDLKTLDCELISFKKA